MYRNLVLFILSTFIFSGTMKAQQSILLTNGKRILIKDSQVDSSGIIWIKKSNNKIKGFEQDEVFSLIRVDSVEVIFYKPLSDDDFKIDQMRHYIYGQGAIRERRLTSTLTGGVPVGRLKWLVRKTQHWQIPALIGGMAVGFGSGMTVNPYLTPVPVVGFSFLVGAFNVKDKRMKISDEYLNDEHYKFGYKKSIKRKRVINSIIGGGVGLVAGLIVKSL